MNIRRIAFAGLALITLGTAIQARTPSDTGAPGTSISRPVLDRHGELVHTVTSPYQAGTTRIRVILPKTSSQEKRYRVVYVLPVVAGESRQWGDGLDEVRRHDLANRHDVICVAPTFSHLPWFADHPRDAVIRQESYLLRVVVPFIERTYRVVPGRAGRLLVGFSKSGWGAFSLILRHPEVFERAAAWDAPFSLSKPGRYGSGPIFGTPANFEAYDLRRLVEKRWRGWKDRRRLIILGHGNFHADHEEFRVFLERRGMPHVYTYGPPRRHHWDSGWLVEAFEELTDSPAEEERTLARRRVIDRYLETCHRRRLFNGVVLAAKGGVVEYHRAFGVANVDGTELLRPDSSFRLASVSKSFTALSILILETQGALRLDDDVRKYLPSLPYEGITIRHLVHHTSGLPDYVTLLSATWDLPGKKAGRRRTATSPDALALLAEHHPARRFAPGTKWEYSNTGYVLLGLVVEKVSGIRFGSFLRKNVFDPLGMRNTLLFTPTAAPKVAHRAFGFRYSDDGATRLPHDDHFLNGMYGDGEVYSRATDLLLWDRALYTEKLLPGEVLKRAFQPGTLADGTATRYGFGWLIDEQAGRRRAFHAGSWVGFRSWIERDLKNERVLIVLTNDTNRHFSRIHGDIGRLIRGEKATPP